MARPDKTAAVAELAEEFRSSAGAVLTDYRGLTVKQLQDLRRVLGDGASYAVVKNTLTKIAADEAGLSGFDDLLVGPTAIAFIKGDVVEVAKGLRDFARTNPPLVIKGGILDGQTLSIGEIAKIADLESREVLLGRMAGALLASIQNAAYMFNEPLAKAARLAGALQAKAEEDPSILAGGAGVPDQTVVPTVDADATSAAGQPADDATSSDDTTPDAAPVGDVPALETPVADAPATDTVVADAPAADTPAVDTSAPETAVADAPPADTASGTDTSASDPDAPVTDTAAAAPAATDPSDSTEG
jgi:large subunit ribosomal protein L10